MTTTNTIKYRFTSTGSSPHQTVEPREIDRTKDDIPADSTDHWFLNTLRISKLDPTFPVGTKLTLEVPGGYVRTWEIVE